MYIGIDLGGTNIAGGLVNDVGHIIKKFSTPTLSERGSDAVIEDIIMLIEKLMANNPTDEEVESVGIGIPGIADPHTGVVLTCVNINWYNVPLREKLHERIDCPIFIDNDATVAGVAEFIVAQKGKYQNAVLLTLGTGIGGGILYDGKVVSGFHGIGSEVGHMIIGENFYDCNCGRNGCLETYASSTAIIRYAKHLLKEYEEESLLLDMTAGNLDQINGEIIFNAAKAGDAIGNKVVDRLVKYLSIGIMNIISVVDPEVVVLGGGISLAGSYLVDKITIELTKLRYFKNSSIAKIELAKLQNDAGIIGAAMYAKIH